MRAFILPIAVLALLVPQAAHAKWVLTVFDEVTKEERRFIPPADEPFVVPLNSKSWSCAVLPEGKAAEILVRGVGCRSTDGAVFTSLAGASRDRDVMFKNFALVELMDADSESGSAQQYRITLDWEW